MKEWLEWVSGHAITAIDGVALLVVVYGTAEVLVSIVRFAVGGGSNQAGRELWLRYARWLVAALTFQLAADIIETSISTGWEAIARVGAVGVIRTLLDYFLNRDLSEVRARQHEATAPRGPS